MKEYEASSNGTFQGGRDVRFILTIPLIPRRGVSKGNVMAIFIISRRPSG